MIQLAALDAGLLKARGLKRDTSLAIGAVAIVNGAVPDSDLLKTVLAERIKAIPRCTQVLRRHPANAIDQEWIDYPAFDLIHHVRRAALPQPGENTELFGAIAHALERPLDLDQPLWECWIIEGLKGNRWAILMKIHHRMADGISAAHLLARLCDDADSDAFTHHVGAKHILASNVDNRSWGDTLRRMLATVTDTVYKTTAHSVANVAETATRILGLGWHSPTDPVTTMRRYSTVHVSLTDVDTVCRKFCVTTNDVALAAISEGFRAVLLRRGEQPRADSLRTLEKPDHRIPAMLPHLPVEHDDPVQRLQTVHNRLNQTKRNNHCQPGGPLDLVTMFIPFLLCTKMIHALTRLPQQSIVTLETTAPGPRHRLRLMGQWIDQLLPIPPTALQLSTGVAVLSYRNELVFGIIADYDAAQDKEQLVAGIELGMARLVAHSQDSVLFFTKDRRRYSPRAPRQRVSALPLRTRH